MPLFHFRAVDESGQVAEGEIEAADLDAAVDRLRRQGRLVLRAEPVRPGSRLKALLGRDLFAGRPPSARDTAALLRELATLLKAGLPLDRALDTVATLGGGARAAKVAARLLAAVRGGASLADAMAAEPRVFPRFAVGMVQAGEVAGALDIVMSRLAEFHERSLALTDAITTALIYPVLLLVGAMGTVAVLVGVVIPQFRPLFEHANRALPLPTRLVLAGGEAVAAWWWLLPLLLVFAAALAVRSRSDLALRLALDRRLLALPLLGRLLAELEVARLLRGLGTLLANGVPLLAALGILKGTLGNAEVAEAVERAAESLKHGRSLVEPLAARPWFPPVAARLLAVGEETARLDEMVVRAADLLDERCQRLVTRGLALLGPAMTLGLGVLVAGVIAAILLAVLGVNDLAM